VTGLYEHFATIEEKKRNEYYVKNTCAPSSIYVRAGKREAPGGSGESEGGMELANPAARDDKNQTCWVGKSKTDWEDRGGGHKSFKRQRVQL